MRTRTRRGVRAGGGGMRASVCVWAERSRVFN